jgi:hypothetical protein
VFSLLLILTISSYSNADTPKAPLLCNKEYAEKVRPYVQRLIKEGPKQLVEQIQGSQASDLWDFNPSYQEKIRRELIFGSNGDRKLFKIYTSANLKHPASMSADLIRGIWAIKDSKRCKQLMNTKYPIGVTEDVTNSALKENPN